MANFGVCFSITNNTGATLGFMRADLEGATYDGPVSIPSKAQPTLVHLNDSNFTEEVSVTVYFLASVGGRLRQYAWYGSYSVVGSNAAAGPGITNCSGANDQPITINVFIDANTPGWTDWPSDEPRITKDLKAQLSS